MAYKGERNFIVDKVGINSIKNYYNTHTAVDTAKHFNVSFNTIQALVIKYKLHKNKEQKKKTLELKYNIQKFYHDRTLKIRKTKLKKYGKSNYCNVTKRNNTLIKKYGSLKDAKKLAVKHYKETCIKRYGVSNPSQLSKIKDKKNQTLIKNFGNLENAYKTIREKGNKTLIKKYGSLKNYREKQQKKARKTYFKTLGVKNPFSSPKIKSKIRKTIKNKYGVEYACMIIGAGSNSSYNKLCENALKKYRISYTKEFALDKYVYDFKVGKYLLEINPSATHNSNWSPYGDHKGKDKYYHQNKSKVAQKYGYRCIHIFEWDLKNINKIINKIITNKYNIEINFTEPQLYLYNYKTKNLVKNLNKNVIKIYGDGSI